MQASQKAEIDMVLHKIKAQEEALNAVKDTVQKQGEQVKAVLGQIADIKEVLDTKLPQQQDEQLEKMSKAVQETLEANLTAILKKISDSKKSEKQEWQAEKDKLQEENDDLKK